MLGLQCQNLVVCLISMLTALNIVFVNDSGLFLDLRDLFLHLHNGVLGKEYFLSHNVDLCLHVLVSPDGIVEMHSLIGKQVVNVKPCHLLLVKVFLRGYHLLDLVLLLIELS